MTTNLNLDQDEKEILALLAEFNAGNKEVYSKLLDLLAHRLECLMSHILHTSFAQLTEGTHRVGTQTVAQAVRLRIYKGINSDSIKTINDTKHFMRIASRNARWVLLDQIKLKQRRQKRKANQSASIATLTGPKFIKLMEKYYRQLPKSRHDDFIDAVQDRISQMPRKYREVFDLKMFVTTRAAAQELGIIYSTALGRWNMANHWLEQELAKSYPLIG